MRKRGDGGEDCVWTEGRVGEGGQRIGQGQGGGQASWAKASGRVSPMTVQSPPPGADPSPLPEQLSLSPGGDNKDRV